MSWLTYQVPHRAKQHGIGGAVHSLYRLIGAGVVITAAHTIYRGEAQNIHSADDGVVAVMGADFPLSYFHK